MQSHAPPTRSIRTWNTLIHKYIHAHHKDNKYISYSRAHSDLMELYQEFYHCHPTSTPSDSLILAKIHKMINEYYNDVMKSIKREKAVLATQLLSM
jgi:hypothetical protein